eukprot:CAMPEP_0116553478 /NCGR_PEP_ID=MMETSP0397-20121206/7074_1 /TAXON_ID=216820 /ORGANISM="Cyclophora tenuis, Strain ECT3854" /LENGTH=385 /DNA_ID=CAMNT_0004078563 /DNA_START=153 /DNA_END=1310 /DNA_ORIENTATION=-
MAMYSLAEGNDVYDDPITVNRFVLTTFFFAMHGNTWLRKGKWLSKHSVCDWYGINCTSGTNHIVGIDLQKNRLKGAIPTELVLLTDLTFFGAFENKIEGTIPTEIATMSSLETIDLEGNFLQGSIPTELFSMPSIWVIGLNFNELIGTIPTEIGLASNLELLRIDSNSLVGTIPSEIGLCTKLSGLGVSVNTLEGSSLPYELQSLPLEEFEIGDSGISLNQIPPWLWRYSHLRILDLHKTGIQYFPTEIGLLTDLELMVLSNNRFRGTIPPSVILQLPKLEKLFMEKCELTGTIPSEIGYLTKMQSIRLSENSLTGNLPTEMGLLTNLEELRVFKNDFEGTIPTEVCDLWGSRLGAFGRLGDVDRCFPDPYGGLECPTRFCCQCS